MKIASTFAGNHSVDFKAFKIDSTDVLTDRTVKINVNPTLPYSAEKTISYPTGEGFENIWFELKTSVVGVTAAYNSTTGDLEITKATDWVIGDSVAVLFSLYILRDASLEV